MPLSDPTSSKPFFTAPPIGAGGDTLAFELTIDGGLARANTTVTVVVENVNHGPTAQAGPNQTVNKGAVAQLDGSASRDPDSDPLSFTWTQSGGIAVVLSDLHSATPTCTAHPQPSQSQETLTLRLEVNCQRSCKNGSPALLVTMAWKCLY